jgi:hypothetical protein
MPSKSNVVKLVTSRDGADPLNVNGRLYKEISKLLDDLARKPKWNKDGEMIEGVTTRERIAAIMAIGRIQTVFVGLRKETKGNERGAGSAVRKYSKAFTDAASRRATRAREPEPEPVADDDTIGDGFDPDAAE